MIPLISVVTPIYEPDFNQLKRCLKSVKHKFVEHILVLDGVSNVSKLSRLVRLTKRYGAKLIIEENHSGISSATNTGIEISRGEFILFLDQDDYLEKNWFQFLFQAMQIEKADVYYSDTHTRAVDGTILHTFNKPDWSPTRLLGNMYISHFFAFRRELIKNVGGLNSEFDGAQDHDFALRLTAVANNVFHIPYPLYNWQASQSSTATNSESKPYANFAGQKASQNAFDRLEIPAVVLPVEGYPGAYLPIYKKRRDPVSIVIPTAFKVDNQNSALVLNCLKSLEKEIGYNDLDEVVLVSGGEETKNVLNELRDFLNCRITHIVDNSNFNFSKRVNLGITASSNSTILLLNDDLTFVSENVISQLVGHLGNENVGVVGALLLFPDLSIQHVGHIYNELPGHAYYKHNSQIAGFFDAVIDHEVSGVTGAVQCFLKETWTAVGGFSEVFPLNFNDVDFCLKIRTLGYSIIQANSVIAIHFESQTRTPTVLESEIDSLKQRWKNALTADKYIRVS